MKIVVLALALIVLPLTAHAGVKLPAPSPEAVAPVGNNEDMGAATIVNPQLAFTPNVLPQERVKGRADRKEYVRNIAPPVPGNQSGPGIAASRYND